MARIKRSFRSKMLMLFAASMGLSGAITYTVYKILQIYYRNNVRFEDSAAYYRKLIRSIGDVNFFLILFIPLSILFFYLLSRPYSIYFRQISEGINHLARGDFKQRVQISSQDELGAITEDINLASEQLRQAVERGDFTESSKDQLVVNLAHDLRTPLTSVLGYLDLILKEEQLTKEQVRHYLTIAFTKSQRLEKLIDELFEITRMNYGVLKLKKTPININELLIQLSEELYPVFEKNDLKVRLDMATQLAMIGDGDLLARVFENLLTNASRYGTDGQFVDINGYMEGGDTIVVQIVNYGESIPADDMPHLFDMFFNGDKARSHQEDSKGLGLFIAKNIVEQHQGTITAESSLTRTVFEVRLPQESKATE
ncbi:HAMP domain-containing histidine kinase [Paenibacillus motobuensis]|uniref:sensor histidine kinase n=1 Tax=Paenibacillus TaxID=44249 RepID=UPI00203BAD7F|nr:MULTISPECIES: HAMP domain-containing sensor histidine kinase [Paenibacillus]MCM3041893.1 HAMP domain-containing histidine kinase [Paenibacillus lutimineralis]MCM3648997.1 HAMP domain-containing histidine kinase [Paenibacillus motobuensis]